MPWSYRLEPVSVFAGLSETLRLSWAGLAQVLASVAPATCKSSESLTAKAAIRETNRCLDLVKCSERGARSGQEDDLLLWPKGVRLTEAT